MENICVTILHPTNDCSMEVELSDTMLLKDVFRELVDCEFVPSGNYSAIRKPTHDNSEAKLNAEKTIRDNGIINNDTIRIILEMRLCHSPALLISDFLIQLQEKLKNRHNNIYCSRCSDAPSLATKVPCYKATTYSRENLKAYINADFLLEIRRICEDLLHYSDLSMRVLICNVMGYDAEDLNFLTRRNWWKSNELALELRIANSDAENLLKMLGYKFHDKIMLFSKTEETDEIFTNSHMKNDYTPLKSSNRINVTFLHPTNNSSLDAELNDDMTANSIINELIEANYIPVIAYGNYALVVRETAISVSGFQTISSGGAEDRSVVRVVLVT